MIRYLLFFVVLASTLNLSAQNLHAQLDFSTLRAAYKTPIFKNVINGGKLSGQLAIGFNHLQLGVESNVGIATESFLAAKPDTTFQINTAFSGVFLRANFSSIPAYRLGLVAKIGIGWTDEEAVRVIVNQEDAVLPYSGKVVGINTGIGLSGPIQKRFHWEFMYQLGYHQRPELVSEGLTIPKHNAWEHNFKFGVSFNVIWGKTKREADAMISGRGW